MKWIKQIVSHQNRTIENGNEMKWPRIENEMNQVGFIKFKWKVAITATTNQ